MQKKIIAAAVAGLLAAPAFAQTNVTISGNFRAGWESYKLSGCTTGFSCKGESRVSDQSSGLRFNVVEDLGGGLKAWGQLDYRGALDVGTLANSGNTGVGFMHNNWGKFTLGNWDVHYNEMVGLEATRASSLQGIVSYGLMSQVNGTAIARTTRTNNIMMWDSPNWNGFTGRLGYSTNPYGTEGTGRSTAGTGNPGGGNAWTGALRYQNGPWNAGLSYWKYNNEDQRNATAITTTAGSGDQTSTRAWLGYTFAMGLKLGIAWDRSKADLGGTNAAPLSGKRNAWMIPVSYTFGPHAVYFNYARAGNGSGSAFAPGANTKASQWMLGYDYAMSKRTAIGAYYTKVNNKGAAGSYDMFALTANGATATSAGEDARQIYVGVNHTF